MKAIVLYLHVHQPYRLRHYTIFDISQRHDYFSAAEAARENNRDILLKVAEKSYLPTNACLLKILEQNPQFRFSLSISGVILDQLEEWAPHVLESFQKLTATGRVEIVAETYHHSLAFFYSRNEFEKQVSLHRSRIQQLFGQSPLVFRNTELAYNNELAAWAKQAGYKAVLAEGWDNILGWRSPNFVYEAAGSAGLKLLLKNYKLSDDIAFRFSDKNWAEWPLTAEKYVHWLNAIPEATNIDLFMDYETFGEHQWADAGIFDFLSAMPAAWLKGEQNTFLTVSQAADTFTARDQVDVPYTVTWADTERDLSAWLGNAMQQQAVTALYNLEPLVLNCDDLAIVNDWRRLQTSDHFYYMCTKWWNDGDIHAYFSPYETPYEAHINFMNAWHDLRFRLMRHGQKEHA